jgi:IS5 family transposase
VLVDAGGIPLALLLSAANVHDSRLFEPLLDAVPPVRQCAGRPRKRPAKLHADKGYDHDHCRKAARRRGIVPRIARRGVDSSERLGRHRWVIERTNPVLSHLHAGTTRQLPTMRWGRPHHQQWR